MTACCTTLLRAFCCTGDVVSVLTSRQMHCLVASLLAIRAVLWCESSKFINRHHKAKVAAGPLLCLLPCFGYCQSSVWDCIHDSVYFQQFEKPACPAPHAVLGELLLCR